MNLTLFMQVLPKAGLGWLGVFAVTIIIVAAVELLEHFTNRKKKRQHRTIPALRLKHRFGGCGTASALPKCSIRHPVLSALLA